DDEIKGIPRRYTEDEWRELTKKKAKGIRPIFKQLALLVSVMIGVALAVSAYSSSGSIGVSGVVANSIPPTPNFNIDFRDIDGYSVDTIDIGSMEKGETKKYTLKIYWTDPPTYNGSAILTNVYLQNAQNVELVKVEFYGENAIGLSYGEGMMHPIDVFFKVPSNATSGENISGTLIFEFEVTS
ncbi:MAG: hypothetical protein ACTSPB_23350, partial [Candidatus Thorarchaeota archaeon]